MPQSFLPFVESRERLLLLLQQAIAKRAPKKEFGLLFSGGIDSVLLALILKRLKLKFKCFFGFVEGVGKPKDLEFAIKAAKELGLELETASIGIKELPALLEKIVPLVETSNPVIVGVALPLFIACEKAKRQGVKTVFCGQGADELFCGYARFREEKNVKEYSKKTLQKLLEKDLPCFEKIVAANALELCSPFLDKQVVDFALSLPDEFKLTGQQNKFILRELAKDLGLKKELAERKKTAAQYGSNFDKAIEKLAKLARTKGKAEYLQRFAKKKNLKIASLFSGGKDSCLSLWIMQRQNYEIACLVSILPARHDSFMYHKPNEKILRLQSKALGIPLLTKKTEGKKEVELSELKAALAEAKQKFGIQGVVSGALYSNYQRERIQNICDDLQLKLFSPLWHKKQEEELQELVDNGFVFIFTKIAAAGLDENWLGKPIGKKEIAGLEKLNARIGLNVAGGGGEFESLVLDAPNFKQRIRIVSSENKMLNDCTGVLKIKKAVMVKK